MKIINQNEVRHNCYIEEHYKVDHTKVAEPMKNKFVTLGSLFGGKPICSWCLGRLALVADNYGYSQQRNIRGGINVEAHVSQEELIKRSPLRCVFDDVDVTDPKFQLDNNLFELEPQMVIQPKIESEMNRISGARTIRNL